MPFIALLGDNITALRIPYWLMWISTCFLLSDIAGRLGGRRAAFICGILIVGTGLFNLEIQGLGHGAATFFGVLIIYSIFFSKLFFSPIINLFMEEIISFFSIVPLILN